MRKILVMTVLAVLATGCGEESGVSTTAPNTTAAAESATTSSTASSTTSSVAPTSEQPAPTTVVGDTTTTTGSPPEGSGTTVQGTIDPGMGPYLDIAVADLAGRLGVDPSAVEVVSAVLRTWSDTSMGCPQPGMRYPQVPQDGSLIELRAGGKIYRYHSGGSRQPFLCEQPLDKTVPPQPIDLTGGGGEGS